MNPKVRLFLASFLILFLELSLIRFIPANLRLIGYFSNLILLGTFLGMGIGLLLAKSQATLIRFFPFSLVLLLIVVTIFRVELTIPSSDILFFRELSPQLFPIEPEILLPIVFLLVTLVFVPLSQELGRLFRVFTPLTAYTIDIAGALTGILAFSLVSYLSLPSSVWLLIVSLTFLPFLVKRNVFIFMVTVWALMVIPMIAFVSDGTSLWSPYYKLTITQVTDKELGMVYGINANNIGHQYISDYKKRERFYSAPFDNIDNADYKNVLIIGSGTGADIATVLAKSPHVERIDAVDIDPKLIELGRLLNPNKPFDDPRVTVIINDGRNVLQNSDKKYDLIIFALTDSVTITGTSANIRLESFLFTKEAFMLAKNRLSDQGLMVLYNYYREDWLIDKIARTLEEVFGEPPYVETYGEYGKAAAFLAGPRTTNLTANSKAKLRATSFTLPIAQDDWPFIYLTERTIPAFYAKSLLAIIALSIVLVALIAFRGKKITFDPRFFFLGAGFMLLETKHLVTFGLLFGTTWLVNSLVFAGILSLILVANIISIRFTIKPLWPFYGCLFIILALNFVISPSYFFLLSPIPRYVFASIFYFSPIFFANIIFAAAFKNVRQSNISFGSNMLGASLGGTLEYAALATGYQFLLFFVIIFYGLSLWRKPLRIFPFHLKLHNSVT